MMSTCSNCLYWARLDGNSGHCRFENPKTDTWGANTRPWPKTKKDEWCGRYLEKFNKSLADAKKRADATTLVLDEGMSEDEIKEMISLFLPWKTGEAVEIGALRQYDGDLYKCVQAHTTQADWTPDVTPALWTIKSAPGVIPVWVQPTGAQDSYDIGDKVQWPEGGTVWESTINANTTVPGENLVHGYWTEVAA